MSELSPVRGPLFGFGVGVSVGVSVGFRNRLFRRSLVGLDSDEDGVVDDAELAQEPGVPVQLLDEPERKNQLIGTVPSFL